MKAVVRIVPIIALFGVALIGWGCEMATGNVGAGDRDTLAEMDRAVTDLNKKVTELTREVAELEERVARNEAAMDAYVSGKGPGRVVEEAITEKDTSAGGSETPAGGEVAATTPPPDRTGEGVVGGAEAPGPTEPPPKDAQALYDKALSEIMDRKAESALALFTTFVGAYPNSELTDNAYYWIGECHYLLSDYPEALAAFKKVKDDFPGKDKVPDAILKMGYCYEKLGDKKKAHDTYTELVNDYPANPTTDLARERLKEE
jgi:tol-pal system protein YbgF